MEVSFNQNQIDVEVSEALRGHYIKDTGILRHVSKMLHIGICQVQKQRKFESVKHTARVLLEEAVLAYWEQNPEQKLAAYAEYMEFIDQPQTEEK